MKKATTETLADRIAGVLNAAPKSFDPEDDANEETSAKVTEEAPDEDDSDVEHLLSKFRKQNIDLLEDVDVRYAGKKGSRKSRKDSEDDDESDDDGEAFQDDEESDDGEDDSEEGNDDDESDEGSDVDESGEEFDLEDTNRDDGNFKHLKTTDTSIQMQKGACIKNQLNLWEGLLEMRIQLQKCLITSNKMPQHDAYKSFREAPEFQQKCTETKNILGGVLEKMLELQKTVIKRYPDTKKLLKEGESPAKPATGTDEEIPSDTEESSGDDEETVETPKKKMKLNDYNSEIERIHKIYAPTRNEIIQKWNDKTRIATGKSTTGHSVINQIEHSLSDRSKLMKRTQLKRSDYKILAVEAPENTARFVEEYNTEIYDDDDFYHQLLRELIEVKSADLTDPVQLGRQWIQLQNLRSKMKRKIDTRATKGRKIRYAVHTKLVNYMAPIDAHSWTNEAKTELYGSLFGKTQTT